MTVVSIIFSGYTNETSLINDFSVGFESAFSFGISLISDFSCQTFSSYHINDFSWEIPGDFTSYVAFKGFSIGFEMSDFSLTIGVSFLI